MVHNISPGQEDWPNTTTTITQTENEMNSNPKAGTAETKHASQDKLKEQHDYYRVEPRNQQLVNEPPELIEVTRKGGRSTTLVSQNNQKQNTYAKKSQDDFFDLILICETQNIQIPIERHQGNHQS